MLCAVLFAACEKSQIPPPTVDHPTKSAPAPVLSPQTEANREDVKISVRDEVEAFNLRQRKLLDALLSQIGTPGFGSDFVELAAKAGMANDLTFSGNVAAIVAEKCSTAEIASLLKAWPDGGKTVFAQQVVEARAAAQGFDAAIDLLKVYPATTDAEKSARLQSFQKLGKVIASADVDACLNWVQSESLSNEDKARAQLGLYNVLLNDVSAGKRESLERALTLVTDGALEDRLYALGFDHISQSDPAKAREWILNIETDKPLLADRAIVEKATQAESTAYINALYDRGYSSRGDFAFTAYAKSIAERSPRESLEWIAMQLPELPKEDAIAFAAANWAQRNKQEAIEWARTFRDRSVAEAALKWMR